MWADFLPFLRRARSPRILPVIPAFNSPDFSTIESRFATLKNLHITHAHVDVSDGKFSPASLFPSPGDASRFERFAKDFFIEAHLMVEDPRSFAESWIAAGARRVVMHVEKMPLKEFAEFFFAFKRRHPRAELGAALLPETDPEYAIPYIAICGYALVLAVPPGFSGQTFREHSLETIEEIRRAVPSAVIEVDGGLNAETAVRVKRAGASVLVSGSYLFDADNFAGRYRALVEA
jgi:ribulose-phosphate 3-epimerase